MGPKRRRNYCAGMQTRPDVARPVILSALLAAEGVDSVVVGSTALRLRGFEVSVGDLDIVPDLQPDALRTMTEAIGRYRLPRSAPPSRGDLAATQGIWTTPTIYGTLDVLMDCARRDGAGLRVRASTIRVFDVDVLVASSDDAWALRHRFKTPTGVGGCW